MKQTNFLHSKVLLLLTLFLMVWSCARNPVTGKRQLSFMSTKQEISLGVSSDPQVLNEFGLYGDSVLQKYIEEKGKAMAAISHRKELPWTFRLVDSDVVNAFALPGGYVYFTRGIMAHFNNEAQFAGVLGHEIGHVTARHGAQQYTKGTLAQIGLIAGMIASPQFAQFSDIASQGVQLLLLKNGRDHESQSDELGVEYSSKIGYDAREMAGFFTTLKRITDEATGGQSIPTFMSTHPDPVDRHNKVDRNARLYQRKKPGTYEVNRDKYLRMIDGLIYGEDPKAGYVEDNIFYHPELLFKFRVPTNWKHHNAPTQLQIVSPDNNAMILLTLSAQKDLRSAGQEVVKQFSLKVLEERPTTIHGNNALMIVCDQMQPVQEGAPQQQQPQKTGVRVISTLIEYDGRIYVLHGVSEEKRFESYINFFKTSMESFEKLTDQAKISKKPERVRIRTVAQTGTVAEVLKTLEVPASRIEELAILNGMEQKEVVQAGSLMKVVERGDK